MESEDEITRYDSGKRYCRRRDEKASEQNSKLLFQKSSPQCANFESLLKKDTLSASRQPLSHNYSDAATHIQETPIAAAFPTNRRIRLLFTYKDINATEISDLPATDLYVHKVKLKDGSKSHNEKSQRRWPRDKLWWLNKSIQEGWDCGIYEPTTARENGKGFSPWNAQANLITKSDQPKWGDEPRITFN
ncbi:hypothetical protein EPUL_005778 [Erysiphe pulchra]|uniref:Uncharacterized protein n=1 Tax=Erysiphe pulchra TaxID=225359 RepID=A0A2S4PRR3_9PEZI|nr:hypothetical protein EPUL_005778 [Erysiphe pulchra]